MVVVEVVDALAPLATVAREYALHLPLVVLLRPLRVAPLDASRRTTPPHAEGLVTKVRPAPVLTGVGCRIRQNRPQQWGRFCVGSVERLALWRSP